VKKQILIAGLGRFGQSLALGLEEMGAEVMGIDAREEAVNEISDRVTHVVIADTTEEKVIEEIGVAQFDAVVCAIGNHLEASLMTTVLLKEYGAKMLVAKASSALHGRVLEKVGVDRVIYPEREVAARLARDFMVPREFVEVVPLTVQHSMFELKAPPNFAGQTLAELDLRSRFGFLVVAVRRGEDTVVAPGPEEVIRRSDLLVVVGDRSRAEEAANSTGS
jgi:trk system potassium uptake protein TrkA